MDRVDEAQQSIEASLDQQLKIIRSKLRTSRLHSGYCYYCYERVRSPHLYCDLDCRDLYEEDMHMREIEGE